MLPRTTSSLEYFPLVFIHCPVIAGFDPAIHMPAIATDLRVKPAGDRWRMDGLNRESR